MSITELHHGESSGTIPDAYGLDAIASYWDATRASLRTRALLSQSDTALPSFTFAGENHPIIYWQTLPNTQPAQDIQPGASSLPDPAGVSSVPRQICPTPFDDVMRYYNTGYEGSAGARSWPTGEAHSSDVALVMPSVASSLPPATTFPENWVKIPQRIYHHGSKQWSYRRSEPIRFSTEDHPGINLGDALRKDLTRLTGSEDPMLQGLSGAISCRLLFPGYPENNGSRQIPTQDWTKARQPIRRSKLAYEVARKLDRYLTQLARINPDGTVEDCWRVGHGFMHIDNMFLVSLESVSKGSFQPEIWVAAP
ncbi:hypothetical protein BJ322DRAFT_1105640 [Thelephora terrestris]|uniref:Uncharacterized protein n=1 Tax=Thelephora terrestris TaxID=56493 RepID=A0A9P6L9U4_9AGAM|nr:hypothetical protein BJ322DRAFT_1105640 [Thelephora terrestris]